MQKKQMLFGVLIFLLLLGLSLLSLLVFHTSLKVVHYHAGFQVYNNGQLVDFSDWKYMDTKPCTANGQEIGHQDDQIMKAHLHEQVGDVVHVHREPAYWRDLFINSKYPLPSYVVGYINGIKVNDILDNQIHPYDSAIFLIGTHRDISYYMPHAVTKNYIQSIEKHSELCGT